jgi:hypothetical protein
MPTIDLSQVIKGNEITPKPKSLRAQRKEARRIIEVRKILNTKKPKPDWKALNKMKL